MVINLIQDYYQLKCCISMQHRTPMTKAKYQIITISTIWFWDDYLQFQKQNPISFNYFDYSHQNGVLI